MNFHQPAAVVFVPDDLSEPEALARTTHLGIGAHQDDLEFMAYHGILACYQKEEEWFAGVVCTDGKGSSRAGDYAAVGEEELAARRVAEQNAAAVIGQYGCMVQLGYPSPTANDPSDKRLSEDLEQILRATRPQILYTHNPADKHRTHLGVFASVWEAVRRLPREARPQTWWGCEVWRDLDWLPDGDKVVMDVSGRAHLAAALNGVFDSQIAGGKRYDLAVAGRRAAAATFGNPHASDAAESVILGLDLTPLLGEEELDPVAFTMSHVERFAEEVRQGLNAHLGRGEAETLKR
jgi:LmbE family N-acetylglucosaminyl deacetylase